MLGSRVLAIAMGLTTMTLAANAMQLTSPALEDGGAMPMNNVYDRNGCGGGNVSPALQWSGAPVGTQGFALTLFDPDAPTGHGWWHWIVADIPGSATGLAEGASAGGMPAGALQLRNDFGETGYGGPCPPKGNKPHRYVFTVYALAVATLPVDADTRGADAEDLMKEAALGKASLTVTYGR